jgi:hypothetical protein
MIETLNIRVKSQGLWSITDRVVACVKKMRLGRVFAICLFDTHRQVY